MDPVNFCGDLESGAAVDELRKKIGIASLGVCHRRGAGPPGPGTGSPGGVGIGDPPGNRPQAACSKGLSDVG
jgi:hypothetical protein